MTFVGSLNYAAKIYFLFRQSFFENYFSNNQCVKKKQKKRQKSFRNAEIRLKYARKTINKS